MQAFVRGNLGAAMQGLVAVPLFAGYDEETRQGRILTMPFYFSPEQQMKDKADYARKSIARGHNSVVMAAAGERLVPASPV